MVTERHWNFFRLAMAIDLVSAILSIINQQGDVAAIFLILMVFTLLALAIVNMVSDDNLWIYVIVVEAVLVAGHFLVAILLVSNRAPISIDLFAPLHFNPFDTNFWAAIVVALVYMLMASALFIDARRETQ